MSRETQEWLNNNVLRGYTAKRGKAWHWQAGTDNHYEGAIPVEDVRRRLFSWEPVAGPVQTVLPYSDDQGIGFKTFTDYDRQVIVRPDTGTVLGVFKSGYQIHSYNEWLVNYVGNLLDADLAIGSAGLLKGGAVAWVQIELEDTLTHSSGVNFRSFITAATSLDGSLATTYKTGNQVVECDNTLSAALGIKDDPQVKIKHSKKSLPKIEGLRNALELVVATQDEFSLALDKFTNAACDDARFERLLDVINPIPVEAGRGQTMAENKRQTLWGLWLKDPRCAPYRGTEWGAVQTVNTYAQHESIIRGQLNRAERNALEFLKGSVDEIDLNTVSVLATV